MLVSFLVYESNAENCAAEIGSTFPSSSDSKRAMSDGWDDWDDEDTQINEAESDGWDWPAEEERESSRTSAPTSHGATQKQRTSSSGRSSRRVSDDKRVNTEPLELESAEEESRFAREVEDFTDKFFAELGKYLEDIADPSVRENINKVRGFESATTVGLGIPLSSNASGPATSCTRYRHCMCCG